MCLHLSGAPYLLNSSYIRQVTFRLYLVTEIRIVRQINNKIDSEGNELNEMRASNYNHFYFVSHCLLSVYSFVCLHLSRALYFLNSRFIHLTWCPCRLVTEIRIVRQINYYYCRGRKLNYCIKT